MNGFTYDPRDTSLSFSSIDILWVSAPPQVLGELARLHVVFADASTKQKASSFRVATWEIHPAEIVAIRVLTIRILDKPRHNLFRASPLIGSLVQEGCVRLVHFPLRDDLREHLLDELVFAECRVSVP